MRPWLEGCRCGLSRSLVVAPTRGQTQALKQRCLDEGIELLGVEFLTPGLARRKRAAASVLGKHFQLLFLRAQTQTRLSTLGAEDPARLVLQSLASDLEAALADYEDLLRGGFRAEHFPDPQVRAVFGELERWSAGHGFTLGAPEGEAPAAGASPIADRLLVLAGGPEGWPEFFGLAALACRCARVTVVVAEPEWFGREGGGEAWVDLWEKCLGAQALPVDAPDPQETCEAVGGLWSGDFGSAERAHVIAGRSAASEMARVADWVEALLDKGSDNIAVVFPGGGCAHAELVRRLEARGTAFADLIGTAAPGPVDARLQRAVIGFLADGARLEGLLALWPLLRSQNLVRCTLGEARAAAEHLFDEVQSHALVPHLEALEAAEGPNAAACRELARAARLLLPAWPPLLTLADALARFDAVRGRLMLGEAAGWSALREFAARVADPMPARAILESLLAFLPEKGPPAGMPAHAGFARVTLTTPRRACGIAWSDVVFTQCNEGVWPQRRESSPWLADSARRDLTRSGRFALGLPTADLRAVAERRLLAGIARDTRGSVCLSASVFDGDDPETPLEPNAWMERVLWEQGLMSAREPGAQALARLAGDEAPAAPPAPAPAWLETWTRRRDPAAPFDEEFFGDPHGPRPTSLSASQIEKAVADPAQAWFDAVLKARRVEWRPLKRSRGRMVGTLVHRVIGAALKGESLHQGFFHMPRRQDAVERLAAELSALRARLPPNRYGDSLHSEVRGAAEDLLGQVYGLPKADFAAVELWLPREATVPAGPHGPLGVRGRLDLVLSDRPGWAGSRLDIVDFKTGSNPGMSARTMASSGNALQLGVYLEAARSLGACGSVWMLRRGEPPASLAMDELGPALEKLEQVGRHLDTGVWGALTADRSEYRRSFEWPLACAPIRFATLASKFAATFGAGTVPAAEETDHG